MALALSDLSLRVLPIWARQLATSRSQSDAAVHEMLAAFAVIGPFLQKVQHQAGEITKAMNPGAGGVGLIGLADACEKELAPILQSGDTRKADSVQRVLELIRQAAGNVQNATLPVVHDVLAATDKVDQMYVGFQYQDRINQIMALLQEDMTRLHRFLEQGQTDALDADAWLARLESLYAMAEQRLDHGKNAGDSAAPAHSETSFF